MANVYRSTEQIVQDFCDDFKAITGITLTPSMKNDTNVIKFWTWAGAISASYAEKQRTVNDINAQTASEEELERKLAARTMPPRIQPQSSNGQIQFTLTGAAPIPINTQVRRKATGDLYQTIEAGVLASAGSLVLYCSSIDTGNDQNISADSGEPFELVSAIVGVNTACVSASKFLDGRDLETPAEMAARVLEHDQDDNSGGNATAYETWAYASSGEVVTAKCLRLVRGADTVNIVITSGTTDISAAVEAGQTVSRLPSAPLIATVLAYIQARNPVTDDVLVLGPTEQALNVTLNYSLYDESASNRSYVDDIITKVIKTYLYQAKSADVLTPSAIERLVDQRIGDLVKERTCSNLNGGTSYYVVANDKIITPGTITLGTIS